MSSVVRISVNFRLFSLISRLFQPHDDIFLSDDTFSITLSKLLIISRKHVFAAISNSRTYVIL